VLTVGSLIVLALYDVRLAIALAVFLGLLHGLLLAIGAARSRLRPALAAAGLLLLAALFVYNKQSADSVGPLPSQHGLVFLGVSYLVLKASAVLIDSARGSIRRVTFRELAAWILFLPTYPSGPIEELDHFRDQHPRFEVQRALAALERILFGVLKVFVLAPHLGAWSAPILAEPAGHPWGVLPLAAYAFTVHFYFDFSGYSDLAIGVSAVLGYEIQENFDNPLAQRNLARLWQRWHMTLTHWLRRYLFFPISRAILRRSRGSLDAAAVVLGQVATMTACGLWHGLGWNFVVWGLLQALGLVWVGLGARAGGRRLPPRWLGWWRRSRLAYALSATLTFNYFALSTVFVYSTVDMGWRFLLHLAGFVPG
jgi:alginate O-acetyltransferase complex protein AlgI